MAFGWWRRRSAPPEDEGWNFSLTRTPPAGSKWEEDPLHGGDPATDRVFTAEDSSIERLRDNERMVRERTAVAEQRRALTRRVRVRYVIGLAILGVFALGVVAFWLARSFELGGPGGFRHSPSSSTAGGPTAAPSTPLPVDPVYARAFGARAPVVQRADGWIYEATGLRVASSAQARPGQPASPASGDLLVVATVKVTAGPQVQAGDAGPSFAWQLYADPDTRATPAGFALEACPDHVQRGGPTPQAPTRGGLTPWRVTAAEGTHQVCWRFLLERAPRTVGLALVEPGFEDVLDPNAPRRSLGPTAVRFLAAVDLPAAGAESAQPTGPTP